MRISFEIGLHRIYEDYVDAGMSEWLRTRDMALARRMFEVSEQHKLASFRETRRSAVPLTPEYWETLQRYRAALGSAWSTGKPDSAEPARLALNRIEASLGVAPVEQTVVGASDIQKALAPAEALLGFRTGRERSWVWALTRQTLEVAQLPGVDKLRATSAAFRERLQTSAATDLYGTLFGRFSARIHRKRDWILSLDDGLFDVPMAALGPARAPLVTLHSTRLIPGAALVTRPGRIPSTTRFVAAADAIYNSADPRWKGPKADGAVGFSRLLNTAAEARAVTTAWSADPVPTLLLGQQFTRASLGQAIDSRPAVLHVAGHVVAHHSDPSQVMIGLGLAHDGKPDFLTPSDIAAKQIRVGLVSVNGCASGGGASLPGSGLVGLTRAWLAAGAESVAATYWPVEDDRGALFSKVYTELGRGPVSPLRAARALQAAQLAARAQNADPRAWAAVFLVSKN
jgi:CHAT domain-containing protein